VAIAAKELANADGERLAEEVPDAAVGTGNGLHRQVAVLPCDGDAEHLLPQPLIGGNRLADQQRREFFLDYACDDRSVGPVIAVIDLADQSAGCMNAGNDGCAAVHFVGTAGKDLSQRDRDRDCLDAFDLHAVAPPSTGSATPVIYDASSDRRKSAALATSSG